MTWCGLGSFKGKFLQVFKVAHSDDEMITDIEASSPLDRFCKELIYCLLKKREAGQGYLPKGEYRALKTKYISSPETSALPPEQKKRTCHIIKNILIFIGIMERVEDPTRI
jgi:hypothetical protein